MAKKREQRDGLTYLGIQDGKRLYRARITWRNPETRRQELDTTRDILAENKREAMEQRETIREQLIGQRTGTRAHRMTLGKLLDEWLDTIDTPGSVISWGSHVRKLTAAMGEDRIGEVTTAQLQTYLDGLALAPGTVNSIRDVLRNAYKHALRRHYLAASPVDGTTPRSKRRPRAELLAELEGAEPVRRSLRAEQVGAFLREVQRDQGGEYAAIVLTQMALGCRFGEVSALKTRDVNWTTGEVVIRRAQSRGKVGPPKSGKARAAVLGAAGLEMLKAHRQKMLTEQRPGVGDGWLFVRQRRPGKPRYSEHYSISTVGNVVKRCMLRCGIDIPVRTHVSRHTMNNLARGQVSDALLRTVVGHSSEEINAVYTAAERTELAALAASIEAAMFGGDE